MVNSTIWDISVFSAETRRVKDGVVEADVIEIGGSF